MTTAHEAAVLALIDLPDPFSARAEQLRAEIEEMEQGDPSLIKERVNLFAAHEIQVGELPPADREPAGLLLT